MWFIIRFYLGGQVPHTGKLAADIDDIRTKFLGSDIILVTHQVDKS